MLNIFNKLHGSFRPPILVGRIGFVAKGGLTSIKSQGDRLGFFKGDRVQ